MFYDVNSPMEQKINRIAREKRVSTNEAERILREMELVKGANAKKIIISLLLRRWQ